MNTLLLDVIREYADWFEGKFGAIEPGWYVFPWGKPWPSDPTRQMTTLKTA